MWQVAGNLGPYARSGVDASGWLWEIERGDQAKRVLVEITGSALASSADSLPDDTRDAIRSEGETEVAKVLDADDPPRVIVCSTSGCRSIMPSEVHD